MESYSDLRVTLVDSALNLGSRVPVKPGAKDGVVLKLGRSIHLNLGSRAPVKPGAKDGVVRQLGRSI